MPETKVATCCYCDTKAALVLTGDVRYELACRTYSALLRRLKMLPKQPVPVTAPAAVPTRPTKANRKKSKPDRKRNRSKKDSYLRRLGRKVFEEIWDEIEDNL
ncbi:MAG: hypothetical protein P8H36_11465 [Yoonia sp.]|nr:hypothetical protein [Yoonia sp.]